MTDILIAGYYGLNNIGDEAILSGMLHSLNKYIKDAKYSVITSNPAETARLNNITPVKQSFNEGVSRFAYNCLTRSELYNMFRQIDKCDLFILGGGSLLQDLRVYYLPFLLSMVYYAQKKGKKTAIYGIGAGPIDTLLGRRLCRKVLGSADLVTVRDPMSKNVLERCDLKNVIQTADPAFGLEINMDNIPSPTLSEGEENHERRIFSSTLYNWLQDSDRNHNRQVSSKDLDERRQSFSDIFSEICETHKSELLFIPTVKIDETGYVKIKEYMRTIDHVNVQKYTNNLKEVLFSLSRSDLLIGMRLHSLILATIIGVPFVPISYCGKVKSYLELVGLEDLYLDIDNFSKSAFREKLRANIGQVENDRNFYIKSIKDSSKGLREKAMLNAKLCAELL